MADNVEITAGSGTPVATDDISSAHYQKIKIALGADGAVDTLVDSGQQTMANSVPVVLASNHSDLKVTLDSEAVVLGAGTAAIGKLAANTGVDIGDVDVTSVVPGVAATNLGKAEDAAHTTGDVGVMALAVRVDSAAALAGTDGDYSPLQLDADGALRVTGGGGGTQYTEGDTDASITGTAMLWEDESDTLRAASAAKPLPVNVIAGGGTGGTAADDDADFTAGSTAGTPAMGVYESSPTSVTDGDLGTVGITAARRLKTSATIDAALPAGTNAIGKLAANSGVDIGDVDVLSVVPGVAATNLGKAEDAAHNSGDTGVAVLAVRTDTLAASSGATGDYEMVHTDKLGALWVTQRAATPYKNIDVDESEDAVSANPCRLMGFYAYANVAAGTKRYLKLYNAGTGDVTVGTTAPTMTFELDGTQGIVWSTPLLFSTALTVAATTGLADNDSGAPGANEVVFNCGVIDL